MPEDNGLVDKVVMIYTPAAVNVGVLGQKDPPTLKAPYITITKGPNSSNIEVTDHQREFKDGTLVEYSSGALESRLWGYGCHGVSKSKLIAAMVQGAYSNNRIKEPEKEEPTI